MKKWKITNPIETFKTIIKESKKIVSETPDVTESEARRTALNEHKNQ
jgi:hypothetical protein